MKTVTIYKVSTGEIVKTFVGPEETIVSQTEDGQAIIDGAFDSDKYMVVNGVAEPLPECPSVNHVFDYKICKWIDCRSSGQIENDVRFLRDRLLSYSDWTQLSDVSESTRLKWQEYRQALRDITLQEGFPQNIIWPTKPE